MRDGVRLAVLSSRLETIARKMANTLFRTARSGLINSARDLSCCILTAGHELLAEAESLPSHVLVGPDIMARTMQAFQPELRRGDAFLHNSPYHGNSHAADHTILVPVIDDAARIASRPSPRRIRPTSATASQPPISRPRGTSMRRAP